MSFILAITGPTGSGKSTVREKLAKTLDRCVNIDADHIKHMVVSGFYFNKNSSDDESGWGFNEWELVGESIGLLAQNFLKHNYDVIINGYIDPPAWIELEKLVTIDHKVLLLPRVDEVIIRDKARNPDIHMGEPAVRRHHSHFSTHDSFHDFTVIDTSDQTLDETVEKIRNICHLSM